MTTDNESVRKEFEDKFPVPEGIIEWNTAASRYVHPTHRISMVADQYNQLLSVWQASRERYEPKWIGVEDRLPEAGVTVLAVFINSHGSPRRICARYVRRWTEEVSGDCEENYCEYSDEHDEYYICEGWYEAIENWGDFSSVHVCEGDVTHWMPLPDTPNGGNEE